MGTALQAVAVAHETLTTLQPLRRDHHDVVVP
jgi:hypothetical protein